MTAVTHDLRLVHVSFLSERWAVEDLTWGQDYFGIDLQEQIDDEVRHSDVLRQILESRGVLDVMGESPTVAFQNTMIGNTARLSLARIQNKDVFLTMHNIMERRATYIYLTYLKTGHDPEIRAVLRQIIEDEKGHTHALDLSHPVSRRIAETDHWLFSDFLPKKYQRRLLQSDAFWSDYYEKASLL